MISLVISFVAKNNCPFFKRAENQNLITEKKKVSLLLFSCWWRHKISNLFSLKYFIVEKKKKKVDLFQSAFLSKSGRGTSVTALFYCIRGLVSKISTLAAGKYWVGHCRTTETVNCTSSSSLCSSRHCSKDLGNDCFIPCALGPARAVLIIRLWAAQMPLRYSAGQPVNVF